MLSAARFPVAMFGSVHLFPILPHNVMLYAILRKTHRYLAYLLFFAFIGHFGAVLFHSLILRDGLFNRMAPWRAPSEARIDCARRPFSLPMLVCRDVYERVATCVTLGTEIRNFHEDAEPFEQRGRSILEGHL